MTVWLILVFARMGNTFIVSEVEKDSSILVIISLVARLGQVFMGGVVFVFQALILL